MSKQSRQSDSPQPAPGTDRLVVWSERRKEPDWDTYIAALLAYSLRQVEDEAEETEGADRD